MSRGLIYAHEAEGGQYFLDKKEAQEDLDFYNKIWPDYDGKLTTHTLTEEAFNMTPLELVHYVLTQHLYDLIEEVQG